MRYEEAEDVRRLAEDIIKKFKWNHIDLSNLGFLRSFGTSSRRTVARCHSLGKAMQVAMGRKGFYVIEVISERFDKLNEEEKIKVIIHELMHIPKTFGGGFVHHNKVNEKNVNFLYEKYKTNSDLSNYLQ
ncbi:MAG: putative metallopeptidase [Candidatus Pacearchaeota archaeon]